MKRAALLVGLVGCALASSGLASCDASGDSSEPYQARFAVRGRWRGPREIAVRIEAHGGALEPETFRSAIGNALEQWEATGCVEFREAEEGEPCALLFSWAAEDHGACVPFGTDPSVAHAGPVGPGTFVHFDAGREWEHASLRRAALHEIGHVLGLDHSPEENAVMHPEPWVDLARLSRCDRAGIHSLYGGMEGTEGDLVVERSDGEPLLALYSVAPRGLTRWTMLDSDGDGDEELLVWRTDREAHGALWEYHFASGPVLERALGPRYGVLTGGMGAEAEVLRGDLDGDGVVEVVGRRR